MIFQALGLLAPLLLAPAAASPSPESPSVARAAEPPAAVAQQRNRLALISDRSDLLVLNDGKEIECRVTMEGKDVVLVRVGKSRKTKEYKRSDIKEIYTIERSLREFFARYDAERGNGIEALANLAEFCEERSLNGEAQNLWVRILLADPENEQAWTKLGGVYNKRRGWRLKVRGRFYTLEQLKERAADWKNAMFFSTAHFVVKSDLEPTQVLDVCFNLERAYLAYYSILTQSVDLQQFDFIPEVHIPKDEKNYSRPKIQGDNAWFDPGQNTLFVDGSKDDIAREAVFHLTQLLVDNSFRRPNAGGIGQIAPWAERAISDAFAGAVQVDDGIAKWEFGEPLMDYFQYHATHDKPLTIKRLLGAGRMEFRNPPLAELHRAQAYTLIHFLAYEDKGKYQDGLTAYLQSSINGKFAATHLAKALGVKKLDELEERWLQYVKEIAGV
ncbi:MAG: hypothetical protein AAGB93_01285 [Planctomycetota bacterium]